MAPQPAAAFFAKEATMYDSHEMASKDSTSLGRTVGSATALRLSEETPLRVEIPNPEYLGGPTWTLVFKPVERR